MQSAQPRPVPLSTGNAGIYSLLQCRLGLQGRPSSYPDILFQREAGLQLRGLLPRASVSDDRAMKLQRHSLDYKGAEKPRMVYECDEIVKKNNLQSKRIISWRKRQTARSVAYPSDSNRRRAG